MKRLVLLGGGHAHVLVLRALQDAPLRGWELYLVSPRPRQIYTGMLPGWVAGRYTLDACSIALDALAARGGVGWQQSAATGLALARNEVECADGSRIGFDLLSIDTGPEPALEGLSGAAEHALPLRPIEGFIAAWPGLLARMRQARAGRFELVILGAGAAGVEIAFAIQHRAGVEACGNVGVSLLGQEAEPLPGAPPALRRRALALLAARGIRWLGSRVAVAVTPGRIAFERGDAMDFDACLVATGAAAPQWPGRSGLAVDAGGFIRVGPSLRSVSHGQVFAAGDVAAYADARPKSGVFAVRAGAVLAGNLRAACRGRRLRDWHPQRHALALISTADGRALASWAGWSAYGRWVWHWKDGIDRRFVARFDG